MITVTELRKTFGSQTALDSISFQIEKGQIFGFLGPSGSGKTTTINILTGQLLPDGGTARLFGKLAQELNSEDLAKIGIVGDTMGYYEKLSLYKNMMVYAKFYGVGKERVEELLKTVGIYDSRHKLAEKLSTGMRQRMLLARALINKPEILFLDEPTSGLDPSTSVAIHQLLLELKAQGTTIFLTTHDMHEATLLCDHLALLDKGQLIETGSPAELIKKYYTRKEVQVTFTDNRTERVAYEDLSRLAEMTAIETIHSCEPTLEDIFINLTGGRLNV